MNHGDAMSVAALFPLGLLFITDGPTSTVALYGVLATLAAGLIGRYLDNKKDDKRHAWELEERKAAAAAVREELMQHREELVTAIADHTATASAQVESVRAALSEENIAVVAQVKANNVGIKELQETQASVNCLQDELTVRLAIGKLLHELFNAKQSNENGFPYEASAFQIVNEERIKALSVLITP